MAEIVTPLVTRLGPPFRLRVMSCQVKLLRSRASEKLTDREATNSLRGLISRSTTSSTCGGVLSINPPGALDHCSTAVPNPCRPPLSRTPVALTVIS